MNCSRCGIEISEGAIERRQARGNNDKRCFDCRVGRSDVIKYDGMVCRPWRGRVDEDLNPIDEKLRPYLPGVRTCGHKDCVNKEHIIPATNDFELERLDISYRTGKKTQWEDFFKESA